jgi:hypothetical protein
VGLTDDQIKAMDSGVNSISAFYAGALWADAKLKELNHDNAYQRNDQDGIGC